MYPEESILLVDAYLLSSRRVDGVAIASTTLQRIEMKSPCYSYTMVDGRED